MITAVEVELMSTVNTEALARYLSSLTAVKSVVRMSGQCIRIYYQEQALSAKKLLKVIGSYGRPHRSRKRSVIRVRKLTQVN